MRYAIALLLAVTGSAGLAQRPAASTRAADEVPVNQVIVYGEDACPASTDDVINVCARLPEQERFRIPPNLRQNPNDPAGQSWSNRAVELSYVGASGIGSCTPTGPGGGVTGCFNQIVQQARAERANSDQVNWAQMIEEARQERLRRIDEAIMEEERQGPE